MRFVPSSIWGRVLVVLVLLVVLVRFGAVLALPSLLAAWAEEQELSGRYERLDVALLSGDVELWHLELDQEDGEVGLQVEFVRADVSVWDLLTGDLVVRRLELDGIDAQLLRDEDGRFHFGTLLRDTAGDPGGAVGDAGAGASGPAAGSADAGPIDFSPPLAIDALRAKHLDVTFVDRSVSPALGLRLTGDLRLSDLGSDRRPTRVELDLAAPPAVDRLRLEISGRTEPSGGAATLSLTGHGLRPATLRHYLDALGIEVEARRLDLGLAGGISVGRAGDTGEALSVTAALEDVHVTVDDRPEVSIASLRAAAPHLGADLVHVASLELSGVRAAAGLDAGGRFGVAGLRFPTSDAPDPDEPTGPLPRFVVDELALADLDLAWTDASTTPAADVRALLDELLVTDFDTAPADDAPPARVMARGLDWPGVAEVSGLALEAALFVDEPAGSLRLDARLHDTEGLAPWVPLPVLRAELVDARLGIDLDATTATDASGALDLEATLRRLGATLADGRELGLQGTVRLERLAFPDAGWPTLAQGAIRLSSPGLIGALEVDLSATHDASPWRSRLDLALRDLTPAPVLEWLPPAVAPRFDSADLGLGLAVDLSETQAGELVVTGTLDEFGLDVDGRRGLGLGRTEVALQVGEASTHVGSLIVRDPFVAARRTSDGTLELAGLAFGGDAASGQAPGEPATDPAGDGTASPSADAGTLRLDDVRLEGLRLAFRDEALATPLSTTVDVDVRVGPLRVDAEGTLADAQVTLAVPGTLDALDLGLRARLDEAGTLVTADLDLRGLRAGEHAAYLPPGLELALEDGRVALDLLARTGTAADGGLALDLELTDLRIADGDAPPVLDWPSLVARASRLDADAGRFDLEAVTLDSRRLLVAQGADGTLELAGLRLGGASVTADATPAATTDATDAPSASASAATPSPSTAPAAPRSKTVRALPDITLDTLRLDLDGLELATAAGETFRGSVSLSSPSVVLLGSDPYASPPVELSLTAAVPPLVEALDVQLTAEPLALEPSATVSLDVSGLDGASLERFAPDLDASGISGGRLPGTLSALVGGDRSGPLDFRASRLTAELTDLAWRPRGDEVAVGLAGLLVEDLDLGAEALSIRLVEITEPRLHAHRDATGIHVAGLVLPVAPAPDAESGSASAEIPPLDELVADAQVEAARTDAEADAAATRAASAAALDGPGVQIRRIYATGLDVAWRDTTTEPLTELSLVDLDVQVLDLDTRPSSAGRPFYFEVLLGAERAFTELRVGGRLTPQPRLSGSVNVSLEELDVTALAGLAAGSGITLSDGRVDSRIELDLREDGSLGVESRTVLENLSLEDRDGVLSGVLKLEAPMDTVLFVLRDENGRIVVPLDLDVPAAGVGSGGVARAALASFGQIVVTAIAQSPFRVIDTVDDLADLATLGMLDTVGDATGLSHVPVLNWFFGSDEPDRAGEAFELPFDVAGSRLLDPDALDALAAALEDDDDLGVVLRHEIGQLDVGRLEVLANPDPADAEALAQRLLTRRDALLGDRAIQASTVDAALAAALGDEAERQRQQLADIDAELGRLENSIDQVLSLLRPGSEARAPRRTREACEEVGALRLDLVRRALRERGIDELEQRLRVVTPRMPREVQRTGAGVVTATLGRR